MKKLLILTILCGLFSCNGNANPPDNGNLPDKKTMAIIKKAEKVVYYSLDPFIKDSTRNHIEGFCTTGFSKGLDKNLKDSLISIILENAKIPVKEDEGKFSAFLPVDVFQFIKGKDTVNFLVDLHCDIWKFSTNEKKFDFDALHAPMEKLIYGIIGKELTSDNMINNPIVKAECKKSIMPDSIKTLLQSADSLVWYMLDPMQQDVKNGFNGFYILDKKAESDTVRIKNLMHNLLREDMFLETDIVKNCTFLPDIGFRSLKGDEFIDVMFSFYCDECKIIYGDNYIQSDCGIIKKEILTEAKQVFPKDRYIRILLNK